MDWVWGSLVVLALLLAGLGGWRVARQALRGQRAEVEGAIAI